MSEPSLPSVLSLISELPDDLINAESEITTWPPLMYNIRYIGFIDLTLLEREEHRELAIIELLKMKVEAGEVMLKVKAIKTSAILALTDKKMRVLEEFAAEVQRIIDAKYFIKFYTQLIM